jgi:hypothetical protein
MKRFWTMSPVLCLFLLSPLVAADKPTPKAETKTSISISPGELAPTQEMWFYEQYQKQYTDPKAVVRQNAEFRAEERMRRMAALRWYGFSNQRPRAGVDLINGDYAPAWSSNNIYHPFRWAGPATTTALVKPTAPMSRLY